MASYHYRRSSLQSCTCDNVCMVMVIVVLFIVRITQYAIHLIIVNNRDLVDMLDNAPKLTYL